MAVVENRFVCDLSKPVQAQALKGNVFSLDNLGSRLSVLIYDNGQPATISGSVTANCILPDGSTVNVNGGLTTENGGSKAYVDIPQSCLLIPGILKIAIKCTSSSVITTLAAIVANVYMTKTDNVITPSQQIIDDWNAAISSAIATQNATIDAAIATQNGQISDLKSAFDTQNPYLFSEKIPYGQEITYQYSKLPVFKKGAYINNSGVIKTNASVTANILVLPTRGVKRIGIVATADQTQYSNAYVVFIKPDGTLYNVALKGNAMTSADTEYYIELNRWVFDYNTLMLINWIGVTGDTFATNDSINIEYYTQSEWEMNLPLKESFSEYVDIYTPCLPVYQTGKYMKRDGTLGNQAGARIVSISPELIDKIEITFDSGHSSYPTASTPFAVFVNRKGTSIDALFPNTYGTYSINVNHDEMDGGTIYINLYDANNWYHEWKTSGGSDIFTTYHMKVYRKTGRKFLFGNYVKRPFNFSGKTVAYIGDSITQGVIDSDPEIVRTDNPWPKLFSEATGIGSYINYAKAGACYYDATNPGPNSMLEQLQQIENIPDYIFVAGGTNDWLFATSFANFKSAVDAVITYINNNFPNAKVLFITPINQAGYTGSHYNDHFATIQKYRDIITQEVIANDNGNFSIIQGDSFNFPDSTADAAYISTVFGDNLHPSELGYRTVYLTNLLQRLC